MSSMGKNRNKTKNKIIGYNKNNNSDPISKPRVLLLFLSESKPFELFLEFLPALT